LKRVTRPWRDIERRNQGSAIVTNHKSPQPGERFPILHTRSSPTSPHVDPRTRNASQRGLIRKPIAADGREALINMLLFAGRRR